MIPPRYLEARPETMLIKPAETAPIIVDKQSACASLLDFLDRHAPR